MELVSIGITSYNARETLKRAVESALGQDWEVKEIIIVDDASSDGSQELIKELAAANADIRPVLLSQNGGVANARNQIITHAKGEFIIFFDDDDVSDPERVSMQVKSIKDFEKEHPGVSVLCHTARTQVFPGGMQIIEDSMGQVSCVNGRRVASKLLIGEVFPGSEGSMGAGLQMGRKKTYEQLGAFDPVLRRGEDADIVIRLGLAGGSVIGISKPLVTQYMTPGDEKSLSKELEAAAMLTDKHADFLMSEGWYDFMISWYKARKAMLHHDRKTQFSEIMKLAIRHPFKLMKKFNWTRHYAASRKARMKFIKEISNQK